MLKNLTIGLRILLGSALMLLVTYGVMLPTQLNQLKSITAEDQMRFARGLFETFSSMLQEQGKLALALSAAQANMPEIQRAFAERDRERLLELTQAEFEHLKTHQDVRQFQFLTPPATSFLRVHMPDKHGDDLSRMRGTVVNANQNREPIMGLERGVAGLGIRGVQPVFYQGEHIGVVEFGMSFGQAFFDHILESFGVPSALQLAADRGFETLAGTIKGGTLLKPDELRAALDGETITRDARVEGGPVLIYAEAIEDYSGKPIGVVELLVDRSLSVAAYRNALITQLLIGAVMLALGLGIAWGIAKTITGPLRATVNGLDEIAAGDGDLTQRLNTEGRNELADLGRAFNAFLDKIQTLVREIAGASAQLASAAEELSMTSSDTSQHVSRQQHEIDQVATAINQMTATVEEVARHAAEAARATQETDQETHAGTEVVGRTIEAIEAVAREVESAGEIISRLSADSVEIGAVLDVIRGIAEQTNLLALNAAIEAARAGEQGRGFAVVADEVRTLASRTQVSTQDIQDKIERVQTGSNNAVSAMEQGRAKASEAVDQAKQGGESLQTINRAVSSITDMNHQIASAAEEQTAVAEEINRNIHVISEAVDQTTSGAAQISTASEELAQLAARLQSLVGQFRV
ncbi:MULTISPECIES: methyl-accepting chemotaxis protein [Thiorhodovibrio]|uniref:methyl-accepting chemotaxis protein n=1 Tax=Thiorhodovibrio TaxID=61593 RepID=UPI0019143091|nr:MULTISPECIES: methyl-accepting chemotaxis protein [Thiorhodovibrio]MBK5971100.1 methyl-accepting chemotaxis protein [Thiorhodovibrio winogradskyi]WPL10532.1 Putative methyl-accepting chemotaxis protein YoaH [Thiorhodovibrio litoralis]